MVTLTSLIVSAKLTLCGHHPGAWAAGVAFGFIPDCLLFMGAATLIHGLPA